MQIPSKLKVSLDFEIVREEKEEDGVTKLLYEARDEDFIEKPLLFEIVVLDEVAESVGLETFLIDRLRYELFEAAVEAVYAEDAIEGDDEEEE